MNGSNLRQRAISTTMSAASAAVLWVISVGTASAFFSMPSVDTVASPQRETQILNQGTQIANQATQIQTALDQYESIINNQAGSLISNPDLASDLDFWLSLLGTVASAEAEYGTSDRATIPAKDPTDEVAHEKHTKTVLEKTGATIRDCALIEAEYVQIGADNQYVDDQIANCIRAQIMFDSYVMDRHYATSMNQHKSDLRLKNIDEYSQAAAELRGRDNAGAQRDDLELGVLLHVASSLEALNKTQNDQLFASAADAESVARGESMAIEEAVAYRAGVREFETNRTPNYEWE